MTAKLLKPSNEYNMMLSSALIMLTSCSLYYKCVTTKQDITIYTLLLGHCGHTRTRGYGYESGTHFAYTGTGTDRVS